MDPHAAAVCSVHPTDPSIGACTRCGRFLCVGCRASAPQLLCKECSVLLDLPGGARFRPFDLSRTTTAAFSLLSGAWLHIVWLALPIGLLGGLVAAFVIPEVNPKNVMASMLPLYAASFFQMIFSAVFGLFADLAALSLLVGRAEGRTVTSEQAYSEALQRWPRAVRFSLYALLQMILYGLLCVLPGVWKGINLSVVNIISFIKPVDSQPVRESESLIESQWWQVFAFVLIGSLITIGPSSAGSALATALTKVLHAPRGLGLAIAGALSVISRALLQAFLLALYYGLNASAGNPPPISADLSPAPRNISSSDGRS